MTLHVSGPEQGGRADLAVISTYSPKGAPLPQCMGNLVAEKASSCADPRVHIHPANQTGASTPWAIAPAGDGTVTIRYTGRDAACAVYLTAHAACGATTLGLAPASGLARQRWVLEPVGPSAR
jgi:hypothetical protein